MRRVAFLALVVLLGAAIVWLLAYAREPDDYYDSGDISRWEHARNGDLWAVFVVAFGWQVVGILVLLAAALRPRSRLDGVASVLAATALLAFPIAWFAVTAGH